VTSQEAKPMGMPHEAMAEHDRTQAVLERMVTAQDIAHTALFLCGSGGRNITGQALSVCGDDEKEERRP
jgi:enoyl-[acyl-carrier-protein] reductase (NADH)